MLGNCSVRIGSTPQESASLYHARSPVARPRMVMGARKRETMRTVMPLMEVTTMALASRSMAMVQAAWEMASTRLWMAKVWVRKRPV